MAIDNKTIKIIQEKLESKGLNGWNITGIGMIDRYRYLVVAQWDNDEEKTPYTAKDGKKYDHPTAMMCLDLTSTKIRRMISYDGLSKVYLDGGIFHGNKEAFFGDIFGVTYHLDYSTNIFDHEELLLSPEMFKKGTARGIDAIKAIGNHFYTTDGDNEIYRRDGKCKWTLITPDAVEYAEKLGTTNSDDEYGLYNGDTHGLDGFNENEIYFGGFDANLWYYNGKECEKIFHLPKEADFTKILCCEDGKVYAIDYHGNGVAVGRKEKFTYIPMQENDPAKYAIIYDAAHYKGKIYIANGDLMVFDGKEWKIADIPDVYGSVEHLASKDGMLFIGTPWSLKIYNGKETFTLYGGEREDAKLILDSFLDASTGLVESAHEMLDALEKK